MTVKIKICGLFRDEDIDYVNEARPDYAGFVFAESRRKVTPERAAALRKRLAGGIVPVGVFVDAPAPEIAALYRGGVISAVQLHGTEDAAYIDRLRAACGGEGLPVIKAVKFGDEKTNGRTFPANADYCLFDSGAGSGKTFDWNRLRQGGSGNRAAVGARGGRTGGRQLRNQGAETGPPPPIFGKPWFLAGGVGPDNIEQAIALGPYAVDVSSGAETDGIKDRDKIVHLVHIAKGRTHE
jgi:phosphoribosylanthranilate isomerase